MYSKNANVTKQRLVARTVLLIGSVELVNLLNLLWIITCGPKISHMTKTRLAFIWCWNLFVQFLLHFQYFSDLGKLLALHEWAVPHMQLFITVWSKHWAWLWTISHQMYLLLIVAVVQFETFVVDFIMSELQTNYAETLNMCIPSTDSKIKLESKNKTTQAVLHSLVFKLTYGWIRLDEWMRKYSSFK